MHPYYGYTPPPEDVERVAKTVIKLLEREKRQKAKHKEAEEKKAEVSSRRMMTALEWFCIGILMQPVVGPLGNLLIHKLQSLSP